MKGGYKGVPGRFKTIEEFEAEATWSKGPRWEEIGECLLHPSKNPADSAIARKLYKLRHGPIPVGLQCCHVCDNPACISDAHHWLGTPSENMTDASNKRRLYFQTEEHRQKMSSRVVSEETRSKLREASKGNKGRSGQALTEMHKARIGAKSAAYQERKRNGNP